MTWHNGNPSVNTERLPPCRPPVRAPQTLLPLSRQPRTNTQAFCNPGFADFSKKMRTCVEACAGLSAPRSEAISSVKLPTSQVDPSPLHANAESNIKGNLSSLGENLRSPNLLIFADGQESCGDTTAYSISKSKNYLDKITNLKPNSIVRITFNDLSLNFKVNAEGDLYFNNEKKPLPIYALPYVEVRLLLGPNYCKSGDKFLRPVAVGHGTEKLNKEAQLEFTFDLQPVVPNIKCSWYRSEKECSDVRLSHLKEFSPCTWMSTKCVGGERDKPFFKDPPTVRRLYKIAGGAIGFESASSLAP